MLGYYLVAACGLALVLVALAGLTATLVPRMAHGPRLALQIVFILCCGAGFAALGWGNWRAWHSRFTRPGLVAMELAPNPAEIELQRIAGLVGANPHQPVPQMASDIVRHLPATVWHMTPAQQDAFGLALDQVPRAQRFPVVVCSCRVIRIPSPFRMISSRFSKRMAGRPRASAISASD